MRKSFLVATVATLALGTAGVAYAQTPDPSVEVTASVSPSKAGTKSKPKSEKLKLEVKNNEASKTTAAKITITLPSTLKLSTSGLTQCTKSDEEILTGPTKVCKSAIIGTGVAHALVNPFADSPAPLTFKVTPLAGKGELLFYLDSPIADAVLHGKLSGKKLTIAIPEFLQQPAPGTYSALLDLSTTLSKTKGKNSLVTSTGCKSKAHKIGVTVNYVPNPNPPSKSSASGSGDAKCS